MITVWSQPEVVRSCYKHNEAGELYSPTINQRTMGQIAYSTEGLTGYIQHVNDLEVCRKYLSIREKSNSWTSTHMLIFVESQIVQKQVKLSQQNHKKSK